MALLLLHTVFKDEQIYVNKINIQNILKTGEINKIIQILNNQ